MSFWDQLDLSYAEAGVLETEVLDPSDESRTSALIRIQFVENRIDVRRSEIPGYDEAHRKLETLTHNLRYVFDVPNSMSKKPYNLSDKNPLDTMNTYLFRLRESIVKKPVASK